MVETLKKYKTLCDDLKSKFEEIDNIDFDYNIVGYMLSELKELQDNIKQNSVVDENEQFFKDNKDNYPMLMKKCVQLLKIKHEYEKEYEEYVRIYIKDLIEDNKFTTAKRILKNCYKESIFDDKTENYDSESEIISENYDNIYEDIIKLENGEKLNREFASNKNINKTIAIFKYKKSIIYINFINKVNNITSKVANKIINELSNQRKYEESLEKLDIFYKDSFYNGRSCFFEYDLYRIGILANLK